MTTAIVPRKHTRFEWCEKHQWLKGETRYRQAEYAAEGGPAGKVPGCRGGVCEVFAGTDLFTPSVCTGEFLSQHQTWAKPEGT